MPIPGWARASTRARARATRSASSPPAAPTMATTCPPLVATRDGEGAAAFDTRVSAELDQIVTDHAHGDILVVTHGGVIQVALHHILGRESRGLFPFKIQNASISLIERRDGRAIIGGVNDIAHLEGSLITEVGPG